jgi:hypothetical protein
MEILKWLTKPFVLDIVIGEFRQKEDTSYINCTFHFKDGSILFCREFSDSNRRKYSFHWQDKSGSLKSRWDNSPHFPEIKSFPHHRHSGETNEVLPSHDVSLPEVLEWIESRFL